MRTDDGPTGSGVAVAAPDAGNGVAVAAATGMEGESGAGAGALAFIVAAGISGTDARAGWTDGGGGVFETRSASSFSEGRGRIEPGPTDEGPLEAGPLEAEPPPDLESRSLDILESPTTTLEGSPASRSRLGDARSESMSLGSPAPPERAFCNVTAAESSHSASVRRVRVAGSRQLPKRASRPLAVERSSFIRGRLRTRALP